LDDVSESSSFCLFAMPDGKSWSFRLLPGTMPKNETQKMSTGIQR
jgi:hypothetical protein